MNTKQEKPNRNETRKEYNQFWAYNMCNEDEFQEIFDWFENKNNQALAEQRNMILEMADQEIWDANRRDEFGGCGKETAKIIFSNIEGKLSSITKETL